MDLVDRLIARAQGAAILKAGSFSDLAARLLSQLTPLKAIVDLIENRTEPLEAPEDSIPTYRYHVLNEADKIKSVGSVGAPDDASAMTKAAYLLQSRHCGANAIEVWIENRLVGRVGNYFVG